MIQDQIKENLKIAVGETLGVEPSEVYLEHPADESHGDYASNVAMQLGKQEIKGDFLENIEWYWQNLNEKNYQREQVSLPVGRLGSNVAEALGVRRNRLTWLRSLTFAKIRGWREEEGFEGHPEIGRAYFHLIPLVLAYPEHVFEDKSEKRRFLLVGHLEKHFALVVGIGLSKDRNWLVTAFMMRERYLKRKEKDCLVNDKKMGMPARTAVSPILVPLDNLGGGGSRFSTLQDTRNFYSKLEAESQEDILSYEKIPWVLAQEIVNHLPMLTGVGEVRVAAPGFINFWLSKDYLISFVSRAIQEKDHFGALNLGQGKKVMVEFGQPNTHKLPHIGHFRSWAIGESIARLLEFNNFEVFRANYQGDVGLHVAKCLWAYSNQAQSVKQRAQTLEEKVTLLQESYVEGNKAWEKDPQTREEIEELNHRIYRRDPEISRMWEETRQWSIDYYDVMNRRLGTKYHRLYFESETAQAGKRIVLENLGKVFEKSQGAIIFPGEKYSLHNRVFITAKDHPTYEAKDLGLIFLKAEDFPYDLSIISTAAEQIEYFKVVYKAAEQIAPDLARKFVHVPFGMVSLEGGKLSSRQGNIVSINELLASVEDSLIAVMEGKKYSQESMTKVLTRLMIGASKYSILKSSPTKDMVFNVKESVALEGNSGPYLQYTYVRCKSVLKKAQSAKLKVQNDSVKLKTPKVEKEELTVLRILYRFPEVVQEATKGYSPNRICNYLFDLAQRFNIFYEKLPIIAARTAGQKEFRLALTVATAQVIKKGLFLLGIEAPERM